MIRGKATSWAPIRMGRKIFPKADGNPGDDEEKDLDDAVEREKLVVGLLIHEPSRRQEAQADHEAQDDPDGEEREDRHQVHDADPFMVGRHHPLRDDPAVLSGPLVEIGLRRLIFQCHTPFPGGIFAW